MTASREAAGQRVRRYVVDGSRCRTCGREGEGLRCDRPITIGYERSLVAARAGQRWDGCAPAPGAAPCSRACPLALCVQGYVENIAAGQMAEALEHVLVRTTLPETVCRVCDRPCEQACVRREVDGPVAVNDLKRFVVGWAAGAGELDGPRRPSAEPTGRTVAVVGAGPGGLTVAARLAEAGHRVTLHDAADRAGGIPALHIPRYRLPEDAVERDVARVLASGVGFVGDTILGRDVTVAALLEEHDAVYLALGAGRPRELELPGGDRDGAPPSTQALDLLRAARSGDAERLEGDIVVIGGGDAAIDAARTALRLGARTVTVACLESRETMPALDDQLAEAAEEGIAFAPSLVPRRLEPRAVVFASTADPEERERWLAADRIVLAIGQEPDASFLAEGDPELARDPDGRLAVDALTGQTSVPRLYAGGDMVRGGGTVTRAIASGLRTAAAIHRALTDGGDATAPPPPQATDPTGAAAERPTLVTTRSARRRVPPTLRPGQRIGSFAEVVGPMAERDARAEAARCLVCGMCGNCRACIDLFACPALVLEGDRVVIEPGLCNGCGVCADLCPNGAIVPEVVP